MTTKPSSVIILAAGNSGRMGSDKALLAFGDGNSFAGHLLQKYSEFGVHPLVLVVNEKIDLETSDFASLSHLCVINKNLEFGRSHSIFLGLQQVSLSCPCFIQNIDNPYIEPELLRKLLEAVEPDSFAVPVYQGRGGHPVLLGQNVVKYIKGLNTISDFRTILNHYRRIEISYDDERVLLNINTDDDYRIFLELQFKNIL